MITSAMPVQQLLCLCNNCCGWDLLLHLLLVLMHLLWLLCLLSSLTPLCGGLAFRLVHLLTRVAEDLWVVLFCLLSLSLFTPL